MTSVYIDGDKEFVNINGGDGDNDGREGDGPEPPQATRAPLQEQQTPILDGELELPPTTTTTSILDGNSDLKQKMEHVLRNLCSGQYGPLLLQFWTLIKTDGLFFLKTQTSHSFLVTPNDLLRLYWKSSGQMNPKVDGLPGVSMFDGDGAFTYLWLPVYLPLREPGFYKENYVGMLQIVSNTKETCLQFFKETRVCDLFQKVGLICSDVVPQHLGMQLNVSTQGSEVPSNFSVDHTGQFTPKEVFNSEDKLFTWARDVGNIKLNTDGTSGGKSGFGGFGGLFRDEAGSWISGYYGRMENCTSLEAKIWAVYKGLTILLQRGMTKVTIETDAAQVVKLMEEGPDRNYSFRGLIEDARVILQGCECSIQHILREGNGCADALAKLWAEQPNDLMVVNDPPAEIRRLLVADMS